MGHAWVIENIKHFALRLSILKLILVIMAGAHKNAFSEKQTGKTLIRLLLQEQSDLGLPCLSRHLFEILEHLP